MTEQEKAKLIHNIEMYAIFHQTYREQLDSASKGNYVDYKGTMQLRDEKFDEIMYQIGEIK